MTDRCYILDKDKVESFDEQGWLSSAIHNDERETWNLQCENTQWKIQYMVHKSAQWRVKYMVRESYIENTV